MVVEIISGIEKIGHSIYDWQIRSGIFKARCNSVTGLDSMRGRNVQGSPKNMLERNRTNILF